MSMNWQDVPRDPITDDDDVELLYQLSELHKPVPLNAPRTSAPVPKVDPQTESNELPLRVGKDSQVGRVA